MSTRSAGRLTAFVMSLRTGVRATFVSYGGHDLPPAWSTDTSVSGPWLFDQYVHVLQ